MTRLAGQVFADVARLRKLSQVDDLMRRPDQLDAVKYRFITAIEGCITIAHHVLVSEAWAAPETNAAALRGLGEHGVISPELAATMTRASGFRNLLVHQYGEIDDAAVAGFLDRVNELDEFVKRVLGWMADGTKG